MLDTIRSVLVVPAAGLVLSISLVAAPAQAGPLQTELTGENEVTAGGVPNQGDLDGSGTFTGKIKPAQGTLCYTITATDIAPATAAHVHIGTATQVGPVVITLQPPTAGSVTACATAPTELLRDIKRNPEIYYVNVHNSEYPAGALRGQLG